MARWVRIGKAAKQAGVCINTMRTWADDGKAGIVSRRTPGGQRQVDLDSLERIGHEGPDRDVALGILRSLR